MGSGEEAAEEQPGLPGLPDAARRTAREVRRSGAPKAKPPAVPADIDPVARVLVDLPLAHLDRPFDYLVPESMAAAAQPGVRVKVRFAGQEVPGFVLERVAESAHTGRLQPLRRVVGAESVLTPEVAALTARVAARWAGTRSDVLRLAVPPRHARAEKQESPVAPPVAAPAPALWTSYDTGAEIVDGLAAGDSPRVVWSVLPGDDWADGLARAAAGTAASGRGALVCVPDRRDVDRLDAALTALVGPDRHVVLSADEGPSRRYASFLKVSRGAVRIVIGTRAAAFAPVRDLGLVAIWDDGDDLFAEPRAPYPHTREVLLLRARETGCAAVVAGWARSVEAAYLLRTGWAREVSAPRDRVRERVSVAVAGASDRALERDPAARSARFPAEAHRLVGDALERGPVLVQTPRAGYAVRLACDRCRTPATCAVCHGPLTVPRRDAAPVCGWCATPAPGWTCAVCGGHGLRAPVVGEHRTAEELGRSFPGVPVRTSAGDSVLATVPDRPAIVVATTGAEPVAEGGYAAVVLLDTWLLLGRADLRAEEEAYRRWCDAAGLVRPGGRVLVVGDSGEAAVQALVRWDPGGFADRLIEERRSAHLPPASRIATLTGSEAELEEARESLALPRAADVLGPVPLPEEERDHTDDERRLRLVVRVPRADGEALATALGDLQRTRSARKLSHVRVQLDPLRLG
ncbi:putative primosomal protein N' [Marmoricola endophyticus]|uniref:Probable replication restart protein PriA n=1 Tax=Marmoricola endophyticus TaxID=2040280 RepID=A0A917BCD8_9ACTN|nr:primosomal protein N' [Marmoricola endophyticus]GGF35745.1 putative primosomal protein N' [Marmoricola endophyticus]